MTGPDHYRAAERHLSKASFTTSEGLPADAESATYHLAMAQVHATLALAAATALHDDMPRDGSIDNHRAWRAVAGAAPENTEVHP